MGFAGKPVLIAQGSTLFGRPLKKRLPAPHAGESVGVFDYGFGSQFVTTASQDFAEKAPVSHRHGPPPYAKATKHGMLQQGNCDHLDYLPIQAKATKHATSDQDRFLSTNKKDYFVQGYEGKEPRYPAPIAGRATVKDRTGFQYSSDGLISKLEAHKADVEARVRNHIHAPIASKDPSHKTPYARKIGIFSMSSGEDYKHKGIVTFQDYEQVRA